MTDEQITAIWNMLGFDERITHRELTFADSLLAVAEKSARTAALTPAAWICIYNDGEVEYTPLLELAEAAPTAIPLYRAPPVEQDANLRYDVPEDGGPITSHYVAPAAQEPTASWDAVVALVNKRALERLRNAASLVLGVIAVHGEIRHDDPRLTELIRATEGRAE